MVKKTIYTDGGCAPINPDGVATYGIICFKGIVGGKKKGGIGKKKNKDNEEILWKKKGQIDHFSPSNNVAELTAILKALETVNFKKENKIFIKSDSQFAIRSILRDWDITAERIVDIHSKIEKKVKKGQENLGRLHFKWIRREYNQEADKLTTKAYREYLKNNPKEFEKYKKKNLLITKKQMDFMDKIGIDYTKYMPKSKASKLIGLKIENNQKYFKNQFKNT